MFSRRYFGGGYFGPRYWGSGADASGGTMFGGRYFGRRMFGGRYWGPAIEAEPEPTETFLAALRTRLMSLPVLGDLADIYLTSAPPGAAYPYLVINRLFQSPTLNTSDSYYKEVAVQFTILSDDAEEADTLGNAAYDALFPSASNPPISFTDGYEMTRRPGMSHGPIGETWGRTGGDPVWRFHFDVTWLMGKG